MSLKSMVASHKLLLAMAEILEDEIFFFFSLHFWINCLMFVGVPVLVCF